MLKTITCKRTLCIVFLSFDGENHDFRGGKGGVTMCTVFRAEEEPLLSFKKSLIFENFVYSVLPTSFQASFMPDTITGILLVHLLGL